LVFGAPPDKEPDTIDQAAEIVDHLHDIHDHARRHLMLSIHRMKTRYDKIANCALPPNPHENEIIEASIIME
jgi:hypothetical protein